MAEENPAYTAEPLCAASIEEAVQSEIARNITHLAVFNEIDSTNDYLLQRPSSDLHGCVVLAERQRAGRGRRGRAWQSPAGNIFLSLGWQFNARGASLEALSPVAGICTCRALARVGLQGHGIKWPNDIQVKGAKLAGILIDMKSQSQGVSAVIGVGINVRLGKEIAGKIDQAVTDLSAQKTLTTTDRNVLAAAIIEELIEAFEFSDGTLSDYLREHWHGWDRLFGNAIHVEHQERAYEGEACGITASGALRVRVSAAPGFADEIMTFSSGEVSVRRA